MAGFLYTYFKVDQGIIEGGEEEGSVGGVVILIYILY